MSTNLLVVPRRMVLLVAFLIIAFATNGVRSFVLNVTGGAIEGYQEILFHTYVAKGVPFAAPPVGPLRFLPPANVTSWSGVRNASVYSPGCMTFCPPNRQENCAASVSEDCLYLNVFTPTLNTSAALPVILWIPGGLFLTCAGGSNAFDGSRFAAEQNVVVVTTNYRLGAFGGLFVNGTAARGNAMLLDQRAAMKWVQSNIATFGGDPNRVALAGESAGGMSIACHLASPNSWPYFQAAILSSNPWQHEYLTATQAAVVTGGLAAHVGCNGTTTTTVSGATNESVLACLQAVPAFGLVESMLTAAPFAWAPVVEGTELPNQPLYAAVSGASRPNTPMITGSMANDTLHIIFMIFAERNMSATNPNSTYGLLMYWFQNNESIVRDLVGIYGDPAQAPDQRYYVERIYTDYNMFCSARHASRGVMAHNPSTPAYQFQFSVVPSFDAYWWNGSSFLTNWHYCIGYVCHEDDLPYDFNSFYAFEPPPPFSMQPGEIAVSRLIQSNWASLAANGTTAGDQSHLVKNSELWDAAVVWPSAAENATMNFAVAAGGGSSTSTAVVGMKSSICDYFDSVGYGSAGAPTATYFNN